MHILWLIRAFQHCLFFLPVKKNRVLFYVNRRRGFVCNPKYIALELRRRHGDQIELIWATDYPESCDEAKALGIRVVRAGTKQHWLTQLTAKAVVINDAFHETVILRPQQVTMNTWHAGMNYKRIGPASLSFSDDMHKKIFALRNKPPMIYISGSLFFTKDTSHSFDFDPSIFMPTGLPRNDILFQDVTELSSKIHARYGLDDEIRLALYAPTFRHNGQNGNVEMLDFDRLVRNLSIRFGGQWQILYHRHHFINESRGMLPPCITDATDYDDVNELLAAATVLVSDYSSCLWDFSFTMRPAFIFAPDMKEYRSDDRGFAYPPVKWPYPIAQRNDELEQNILSFDEAKYQRSIQAHHSDAGAYDDGHATASVTDYLEEKMGLKTSRGQ